MSEELGDLIQRRDALIEELRQVREQIKLTRLNRKPKRTLVEIREERTARHKMIYDRFQDGESVQEIATSLGRSVHTIRQAISSHEYRVKK